MSGEPDAARTADYAAPHDPCAITPNVTALLGLLTPVAGTLARTHGLLEGPRNAGDRWLYSDVIGGGVWAVAAEPDAEPMPVLGRRRGIGGLALHEDGGVVVGGRTLLHVHPDGSQTELFAHPQVAGVNDLHVLPDGSIVAGLLRFSPMAGEAPRPGLLIRIALDGASETLDDTLVWPNGIGHSPDGARLYVSDYAERRVMVFDLPGLIGESDAASGQAVRESARLAPPTVFAAIAHGSADGLAVDADGGVWVALGEGGGIARFHPDGTLDARIDGPAGFVSSLAFGGSDLRDVRVTTADNPVRPETGGTLWAGRAAIAGLPVRRAAVCQPPPDAPPG